MPTDGSKQTARDVEVPDIDTASDDYARRFSGKTGAWFLAVQARAVMDLLARGGAGVSVLDVGGGHNQLAEPLARAGYAVTVHGSDPVCGARVAANPVTRGCPFVVGRLGALPVADRAFHSVVSVRTLAHYADWGGLIAELCRVAGRQVVVDFPDRGGLNRIAPALFGAKQKVEGNTRHWQAFELCEIRDAFARQGFRVEGIVRQFFLPMALHRALRCQPLAAAAEAVFRGLGLTGLWGGPVVLRAVRQEEGR